MAYRSHCDSGLFRSLPDASPRLLPWPQPTFQLQASYPLHQHQPACMQALSYMPALARRIIPSCFPPKKTHRQQRHARLVAQAMQQAGLCLQHIVQILCRLHRCETESSERPLQMGNVTCGGGGQMLACLSMSASRRSEGRLAAADPGSPANTRSTSGASGCSVAPRTNCSSAARSPNTLPACIHTQPQHAAQEAHSLLPICKCMRGGARTRPLEASSPGGSASSCSLRRRTAGSRLLALGVPRRSSRAKVRARSWGHATGMAACESCSRASSCTTRVACSNSGAPGDQPLQRTAPSGYCNV